jgi:hypothetical protein
MTIPEALEYLELATPFTKSDLKKAYREALMVWHPDRFAGNDQLLAKAEVRTKLINDAFALLKEIPETDYPYQPLLEEPQPRQAMGVPPPGTPRQRKAPPAAAKSNAGSWFIVFAVLAVLGAAAFFKLQSGAPEPEIVAEAPVADAGQVIKKPDNTSALPQKTAASKDGTASAPALPQTQLVEPPLPAAIPTKAPASMPAVTAQPKPAPAPPVTPQRSEIDLRLETLEQAFQIATERDAWNGYSDSMAALDKNYLAALERTLAAATSAGKLEDAIALRAEKQRLEKEESMPTAQEEGALAAAPMLKELRKTYRGTAAQYDAARIQTLHTLCDKYDQALAVFQTELTKAAKLDDALHVKNVRDRLGETKNKGFPSPAMHAAASNKRSMTFTNSLGMKFVPVPDTEVMFCIHETRRQDYAAYAAEIPGVDGTWKNQQKEGIPVGDKDDHPVVGMSWEDAQKFCAWLSKKEGKTYRLPTDQEWSFAVGIGNEEKWTKDTTPEMLHGKVTNKFPWGGDFPPKATDQAGNYADTMCKEKFPSMPFIEGYMDNFATTAPVMSFKPNKLGIYDLGGNVWEWCEDWFNALNVEHVLRGGSWGDYGRAFPLSSFRFHGTPGSRRWSCGFRCVLVVKR